MSSFDMAMVVVPLLKVCRVTHLKKITFICIQVDGRPQDLSEMIFWTLYFSVLMTQLILIGWTCNEIKIQVRLTIFNVVIN